MLLILGLSLLSVLYFLLAVLLLPRPGRKDQVVALSIVAGVALSVACIGVLFKVQLWPLSTFQFIAAIVGLSIVLVTGLALRSSRPVLRPYFKGLLLRVVPMLIICIILSMVSAEGLMAFYYRDRPDIAPLMVRSLQVGDAVERERIFQQVDSINYSRAFESE